MAPNEWIEIPVFIHGITPEERPKEHDPDYDELFKLINEELEKFPHKPKFAQPIKVEWGWQSSQATSNDQYLAEAERLLAEQAFATEKGILDFDFTLNPFRGMRLIMRKLLFYGFADMFYYVSKDGEAAVRDHVFKYLADEIRKRTMQDPANISLTFITHSGGTIIAHDLLYHLFREGRLSEVKEVNEVLRKLVDKQQLRIRRFYTMGSPITPLMFRSDSLMLKVWKKERLKPKDIGLAPQKALPRPRWVNFWDKDDVASYGVEFLYDNEDGVVEDKYIDVSDVLLSAHGSYWRSRPLAAYIAENF